MEEPMAKRRAKKKRGREKRSREFGQLMSKLKESGFLEEKEVVFEPGGEEKMSEVIMSFVEPYRDYAHTYEELNKLITLAIVAWNAALLPKDEWKEMVDKISSSFSPSDAEDFKQITEMLVERKRRYFSDNKRLILDYHLSESREGFHLSVASMLRDRRP
jgi:hypothetical protein